MTKEQRFTFNEVAEQYDRARPRYPDALIEALVTLSPLAKGGRVLEIGCGTGQATVPVAKRGYPMLCLEPGPAMARCARERLDRFAHVEVVESTFEAWSVETGAFALVMSAQAFHWVTDEIRFTKAAAALEEDGVLAVFGNTGADEQHPVHREIEAAYATHAPHLVGPSATRWYAVDGPVRDLFVSSGCFEPATWRCYPWTRVYTSSEYRDLLATYSNHLLLAHDQRASLLAAISGIIDAQGGTVEVAYDAHLYTAERKSVVGF